MNKRVFRDEKFIVIKIFDGLTRETAFKGRALLSDKTAVKKLFIDASSKGFDIKL